MTASRIVMAAVVAAVLAVPLAACGGAEPSAAPTTGAPAPVPAPDPDERCRVGVPAEKVAPTAEDGLPLAGASYGSGARGLVLVHQRGSDLCGWARQIRGFVAEGLHVLAIDLRCHGYSACPADDAGDDLQRDYAADVGAAVAELRRAGAAKVAVMGASLGAAAAFVAAGRYPDQVNAVVGLSIFSTSASVSASRVTSASDAAARVTAPALICLSTGDADSIQAGAAQTLIAAGPAQASGAVVVRPGSAHGWDMLRDATVEAKVLSFLKAHV